MQIEFVYFDLGNILVSFDPKVACHNVADLAGITADEADAVIYKSELQKQYETGTITSHAYWTIVRDMLGLDQEQFPKEPFLDAISDMFTPINSMVEVVELARKRTGRVGVLSNTCAAHWQWVRRQPWPVSQIDYDVKILSYEVRAMKPDPKIYEAAEKASRVRPGRILFIDDKPENVQAAVDRGWNAEQCLGGEQAESVIRRWVGSE